MSKTEKNAPCQTKSAWFPPFPHIQEEKPLSSQILFDKISPMGIVGTKFHCSRISFVLRVMFAFFVLFVVFLPAQRLSHESKYCLKHTLFIYPMFPNNISCFELSGQNLTSMNGQTLILLLPALSTSFLTHFLLLVHAWFHDCVYLFCWLSPCWMKRTS